MSRAAAVLRVRPGPRLRAISALPRCGLALLGGASVVVLAACLRVPALAALAAAAGPALGIAACPWRALTQVACPGCGGTRAFLRLAALDLPGALALNPLVTATALAAVLLGGLAFLAPRATDAFLERCGRLLASRRGRLALAAALIAEMAVATAL